MKKIMYSLNEIRDFLQAGSQNFDFQFAKHCNFLIKYPSLIGFAADCLIRVCISESLAFNVAEF